eukprot:1140357-Pelagomonas_calceolata.AAC.3
MAAHGRMSVNHRGSDDHELLNEHMPDLCIDGRQSQALASAIWHSPHSFSAHLYEGQRQITLRRRQRPCSSTSAQPHLCVRGAYDEKGGPSIAYQTQPACGNLHLLSYAHTELACSAMSWWHWHGLHTEANQNDNNMATASPLTLRQQQAPSTPYTAIAAHTKAHCSSNSSSSAAIPLTALYSKQGVPSVSTAAHPLKHPSLSTLPLVGSMAWSISCQCTRSWLVAWPCRPSFRAKGGQICKQCIRHGTMWKQTPYVKYVAVAQNPYDQLAAQAHVVMRK